MRLIESTGKTVDEAVLKACSELMVSRESVEVEVIAEPKEGFLHFLGAREAKVRVTVNDRPKDKAINFLRVILKTMDIDAKIKDFEQEGTAVLSLEGDKIGLLIGRRGQTLDALQYLLNLVANKGDGEKERIILDAEDYRRKREETLRDLAFRLADKVKKSGRRVQLEPMNAHERRIIHHALQEDMFVKTFSEGDEPSRQVVIAPKDDSRGDKQRGTNPNYNRRI